MSYERIARFLCLNYRQVTKAIATLTQLGFVQKVQRDRTTNITRLFQEPHLPLEAWTPSPHKTFVDVSMVKTSDESLRAANKAKRAEKKERKRAPSRSKSSAKQRNQDVTEMVNGVLTLFPEHADFQFEDGEKWLRKDMEHCVDQVGGDSGLALQTLAYILIPTTDEGWERREKIELFPKLGAGIRGSFASWVEECRAYLETGVQPPLATKDTITFEGDEEAL